MRAEEEGRPGPGRLLAGVAWAVLLLGLWLWGRDLSGVVAAQLATTGDVAAVGRPMGRQAPPQAHAPVPASATVRPIGITIGAPGASSASGASSAPGAPAAPGVRAVGVVARDLGGDGTLSPPPSSSADLVGWYAGGPQPGETGAALLVGRPSAFPAPAGIKPGERVEIQRSDGSVARFAVEDVRVFDRAHFDAPTAYAAHERGRAELRLIADGAGRAQGAGAHGNRSAGSVVVVSAYLTSYQPPGAAHR